MSPDKGPCAGGPGTTGMVRGWSEDPLTARARSVWTSGDFLPIARSFAAGAEEFIARLALRPGESVLDVACGTGNRVVAFEVGDAEALLFVDDQFDTTVTMFGAMFAYRPEQAAGELLRVTRPGGRARASAAGSRQRPALGGAWSFASRFQPAAVTELFATCYGPTVATLRASDPDGASQLRQELTRLFQQHNVGIDGITTAVGEYLEVHARVA